MDHMLYITKRCNLFCDYCYEKNPHLPGKMSFPVFKKIFKEIYLKEYRNRFISLVFFGGEPLLNWPLIVKACEFNSKLNFIIPVRLGIVTNGLLLDKSKLEFLRKHKVWVTISYDGSGTNLHRITRTKLDLKKHLEAIFGWYAKQKVPQELNIQWCLTGDNVHSLIADVDYLVKKYGQIFKRIELMPINHEKKYIFVRAMACAQKRFPSLIKSFDWDQDFNLLFDSYDIDGRKYSASEELNPFTVREKGVHEN